VRLGLLALLLVASSSHAGNVRLAFEKGTDPGCPDESGFRQLIAARLGRDPFSPEARSVVTVRVSGAGPYQAELVLETPGAEARRKTLTGADCAELVQSTAVAVALAVDPLLRRPEPPVPKSTPVDPAPSSAWPDPPPRVPTPAAPERSSGSLQWSVSAGAGVELGASVVPQPDLRLELRAGHGLVSVGLEGHFGVPVTGALTHGTLTTSRLMGAVVPCLEWKWFAGCADLSLGTLRLEAQQVAGARVASVFFASVGVRARVMVPIGSVFAVGPRLDGFVPLTRASALVGTERVWTVSPVAAGLGLDVRFRF